MRKCAVGPTGSLTTQSPVAFFDLEVITIIIVYPRSVAPSMIGLSSELPRLRYSAWGIRSSSSFTRFMISGQVYRPVVISVLFSAFVPAKCSANSSIASSPITSSSPGATTVSSYSRIVSSDLGSCLGGASLPSASASLRRSIWRSFFSFFLDVLSLKAISARLSLLPTSGLPVPMAGKAKRGGPAKERANAERRAGDVVR
mmetsp:Transcript_5636/g.14715  ORF Transcript_5636/g.14715 Transcript_5636/m.14715 type:complete len:201 (+) Transcript_5636:461-1063(+)